MANNKKYDDSLDKARDMLSGEEGYKIDNIVEWMINHPYSDRIDGVFNFVHFIIINKAYRHDDITDSKGKNSESSFEWFSINAITTLLKLKDKFLPDYKDNKDFINKFRYAYLCSNFDIRLCHFLVNNIYSRLSYYKDNESQCLLMNYFIGKPISQEIFKAICHSTSDVDKNDIKMIMYMVACHEDELDEVFFNFQKDRGPKNKHYLMTKEFYDKLKEKYIYELNNFKIYSNIVNLDMTTEMAEIFDNTIDNLKNEDDKETVRAILDNINKVNVKDDEGYPEAVDTTYFSFI